MKIERTKNATRNIIFGVMLKVFSLLIPFVLRTVMIYTLGVQYLGLSSLFTSVLSVLNLAELGVGSAMVYSMYKPIAENDEKTICALMGLYRRYYRIIGIVILTVGLILLPFIPKLIKGTVPEDINIYILYLMNLGSTVLSYWLFAYRTCLLSAHQRTDINSKVTLVVDIVQYACQFAVLYLFRSYYWYLSVVLVCLAVANIIRAIITKKMYPAYSPKGELSKQITADINRKVRDVFTAKVGRVVLNSVDSIVISAFLGLTVLAIYNNYYFIMSSIIGVMGIVYSAVVAGIGNSFVTETPEKNYRDMKRMLFLVSWISTFCVACFLVLYQPFMRIWVGEELMFNNSIVVLFCLYFFVHQICTLLETFKDGAGIWHEDRFRPLITALVNLVINIVLVQFVGIYGILLSTIISLVLVGLPWLIRNIFVVLFKMEYKRFVFQIVQYFIIAAFAAVVTLLVSKIVFFDGLIGLLCKGIICCIVPNLVFIAAFYKKEEFAYARLLVGSAMKKIRKRH